MSVNDPTVFVYGLGLGTGRRDGWNGEIKKFYSRVSDRSREVKSDLRRRKKFCYCLKYFCTKKRGGKIHNKRTENLS